MWFLGFGKKIDDNIKAYMKINLKRRLPVIVSFKGNGKTVKNKISYNGGKIKYEYTNINALSCELSPYGIDKLTELPEVTFISMDYKASLCLRNASDVVGVGHARAFNLTGKGIGIGIVDSGVYPHIDLTSTRDTISYFLDLVNGYEKPYDDNGHGTFFCGCIASSGHSSSKNYMGIAPDSNLCMIKAFDSCGNGFMSDIIKGLDILLSIKDKFNIRIVCLPFEFPGINSIKVNPLKDIIKKCISSNIAVIAAAGNHGPQPYSIYFPGNMREVITVGGCKCTDNNIKNFIVPPFSGRGPTSEDIAKPDIIAPSINITSLASLTTYNPTSRAKQEIKNPYITMSGTSVSCSLVAGICALILEKTPTLTPGDIKSVLGISTISVGENKHSQGKGLVVFDKIIK